MQIRGLPEPDAEVLAEWDKVDGVPAGVMEAAILPSNEDELEKLTQAHVNKRQGIVQRLQKHPTAEGEICEHIRV
jgi:hypothetical protein